MLRYVLYEGVFGFGCRAFVIGLIIQEWTGRWVRYGGHPFTSEALGWMATGALWAMAMWSWTDHRYRLTAR